MNNTIKDISIEDIVKLINNKPEDSMFLVPADIFGHAAKHAAQYSAVRILINYYNHWKEQGYITTFDMYGQEEQDVWMPVAQEWQKKWVMKISMNNEKLNEFYLNMNTIND